MGVAATWLPPELWVVQPYSMGALMGCPPDQSRPCPVRPQEFISPASGTVKIMDAPELAILSCLIAPPAIQRDARKRGERGLMMIRAKGLLEALGMRHEDDTKRVPIVVPSDAKAEWERDQESRRVFAEALAALDEDED